MENNRYAWARATIHLPGFPLGVIAAVDLESEYVQDCLKGGFLVLVPDLPDDAAVE